MLTCAITGSKGVLGTKLKKKIPLKFYEFDGDITNKNKVNQWIQKKHFDILIHLAAIVPTNLVNKNYKKAYEVNVIGTNNLINSLKKKKNKPKWLFFSSTSHVYKPLDKFKKISEKSKLYPASKYGKTKMLAEKLLLRKLKKSSIKLCIGRIFSFTDKKQKKPFVIPSIKDKLNNPKKKIIFKNINQFRDFLNIDDVISAIYILMKTSKVGIYNIGSGRKFDLRKIVKLFNKNKKDIIFKNTVRPTYLISNNNKLLKTKWRASKFKNDIRYFY